MAEIAWRSVAALEGLTDDGRWYQSLDWRDLPLTLTTHHEDEKVVGRVDGFAKHAGGAITAWGVFIDTPDGAEAAQLLESQAMRGQSIEAIGDYEMMCTKYEDAGYGPECVEMIAVFPEATIVKVSMVGAPAFGACLMEVCPAGESPTDVAAVERMVVNAVRLKPADPAPAAEVVMASLANPATFEAPLVPLAAWFAVPEPDHRVPLHIEPNGQVFGHCAPQDVCHIGIQGRCQKLPKSSAGIPYFHLGPGIVVEADDGHPVEVNGTGVVTMTTGHEADPKAGWRETMAHYDNTGSVVADVKAIDGKHGLWVCGAARRTISPDQVREFNGAKPSGDWRPIAGRQELVAVLMVNTPGFPVLVASGRVTEQGEEPGALIVGLPPARPQLDQFLAYKMLERRSNDLSARLRRTEERMEMVIAAVGPDAVFDALAASMA